MRRTSVLVVCAVVVAAVLSPPGVAQTAIRVIVDGSALRLEPPPVMIHGRVLVPLRGVFEKLEALVEWKPVTRTVLIVRPGIYVELRIGDRTATVSGAPVTLDVPAQIVGGRVLVPLRFAGEALGAQVLWRPADRTVVISTGTAGPLRGEVAVTVRASRYTVGQPVDVAISNGTTATIYTEDSKTACSIVTLERRTGSGWEAIGGCRFGRPPMTVQIKPGERATATIDPKSSHLAFGGELGFGAGIYRIKFSYALSMMRAGMEEQVVYSAEFPIR